MPQTPHIEKHFNSSDTIRDIIIGMSDGLTDEQSAPVVEALAGNQQAWVDFMMRYELGLEKPDPRRALTSALTIAVSYIVGGFVPLSPYILLRNIQAAQIASVIATLAALMIFGYVKGRLTGIHPVRGALQTMLVGGLAAAAAYLIAKFIAP